MLAASARGPSQITFQLPSKGKMRLAINTIVLDIPKLAIMVRSPPFLRLERVLTYCLSKVITTAGTMVEKNAI